jgi:uncharacterized protein YbcV (DUF1398 family)
MELLTGQFHFCYIAYKIRISMKDITAEDIRGAEQKASGKPYAAYIQYLAELGVEKYELSVKNHDRRFTYAINGELFIPGQSGYERHCADHFELSAVVAAIKRKKEGQTDYGRFLDEIAHAGVHTCTADIAGRQVIYNGKKVSQVFAEPIHSLPK